MPFPPPDANNIITLLPEDFSGTNEKTIKQFNRFAPIYDPLMKYFFRPRIHRVSAQKHQDIWKKMIGSFQKARILDLGCGTGNLIACIDKDNNYTGLDLCYPMLKRAAQRAKQKDFTSYQLLHNAVEVQIFPKESFDLIVIDTALHIIPDWKHAFATAAQSLTRTGTLFAAVPVLGLDKIFDRRWRKYSRHPQIHVFTKYNLEAACTANDLSFTIVASHGGMLYFQAAPQQGRKQASPDAH